MYIYMHTTIFYDRKRMNGNRPIRPLLNMTRVCWRNEIYRCSNIDSRTSHETQLRLSSDNAH